MSASATAPPPVAVILLCRRDMFRRDEVRTARAGGHMSRLGGGVIEGVPTKCFESIGTKGTVIQAEGDETRFWRSSEAHDDVVNCFLIQDGRRKIQELQTLGLPT